MQSFKISANKRLQEIIVLRQQTPTFPLQTAFSSKSAALHTAAPFAVLAPPLLSHHSKQLANMEEGFTSLIQIMVNALFTTRAFFFFAEFSFFSSQRHHNTHEGK